VMQQVSEPASGCQASERASRLREAAYTHARARGLSRPEAEDCAQACVVRLIEAHGPRLLPQRPVRDVDAWLRQCVFHDVQDYLRLIAARRRRVVLLSEISAHDDAPPDWEIVAQEPTPGELLERALFWEMLIPSIDILNRECYVCFVLRHLLGWPAQAIAAALKVPPNHVSKVLARASAGIRKDLQERGVAPADLRPAAHHVTCRARISYCTWGGIEAND
jgi:RNA polymerase sigma factor (sigma-70 family)